MMKRGLYTAFGLILIAIGCAALFYLYSGTTSEDYRHEWKLGPGELRELAIRSRSQGLNVEFEAAGQGADSIVMEGKAEPETVKRLSEAQIRDGRLELDLDPRESFRFFDWGSWNERHHVTVRLSDPETLEKLQLRADSGSIRLTGASAGSAELSTDSGSIRIQNYKGGRLVLKSDSGSVEAERIEAELAVSSDSGSIQLRKADTSSAEIHSDSGSVKVYLPAAFDGFYELQSDTGSIRAPEQKGISPEVIKVKTDTGSIRIEQT
ncbi:DUF4097 family beta strand repeat-containing protein [Cohnella laeviribosi]|uniref:DUF4097 family beta strand repeat-containing protein n=1 Tax=Cohnella laeviribosi TaxID=380174 RepID=UPI003D232026